MRWVSTRVLPDPAPGDDEQRAALVHDGLALLGVEAVEQFVEVDGRVPGVGRSVLPPAGMPAAVAVRRVRAARAALATRAARHRPGRHAPGIHRAAGLGG